MHCYACDRDATRHCSRCGKPYCPDHGLDPVSGTRPLCDECLDPVNATPSSAVFRASVFALLVASVVALWLLVRPPSLPGEGSAVVQPGATLAPVFTPSGTKPVPSSFPPTVAPTAAPGATAAATPPPPLEATAAPETAPPAPGEYTVQDGDTLSGIAAAYGITVEDLMAVNGLTEEDLIHAGDVLSIPE